MFLHNNLHKLDTCLACGSHDLVLTLDLNTQPLANSYKGTATEVQEEYPLAINRCKDCYHVQLTHAVNPELMFRNYLYVSGTSLTQREHFAWFADFSTKFFSNSCRRKAKSVFDIGCNDGSQLDQYKDIGLTTVGIDPAENLWDRSNKSHNTYCNFFNLQWAKQHSATYDIITMQNAFAHNYDPLSLLEAMKLVLADDGLIFIQTSQADMIINNEFDTIYHEHINFFNVKSMNKLVSRAGMYLKDVIKCPIHGTSYIFIISKDKKQNDSSRIENLIEHERQLGLLDDHTYIRYAENCNKIVNDLIVAVSDYTRSDLGWLAVGYGAAAKGMTLLNYSKLKLDFIVDDNPLKQGKFTPGSSIPIVGPDYLDKFDSSIIFVPLAWNFYDEITKKIKSRRLNPYDKFCTYFPRVEVRS